MVETQRFIIDVIKAIVLIRLSFKTFNPKLMFVDMVNTPNMGINNKASNINIIQQK
jgi:hypothetical protein